ncbi:MAG: 1-deoxy-D-xylulose-5-phosphate reductoisomerase, partial [Candidatus Margulisiibacteriota bacterium]
MKKRDLIILGVTGSIGTQALDVIRAFPDQFNLKGMSGYSNINLMAKIAMEFRPEFIVVSDDVRKHDLIRQLTYDPIVFVGETGLIELMDESMDLLLVAIVGTAALPPVVAAIPKVNHIAIANKEVLVAAGEIIMQMVQQYNVKLIPVDSEHSALFQCLAAVDFNYEHVGHVTLTASGGPFWQRDPSTFSSISPQDALKHPNWDMGAKISIDSATMMNKGLEVIEAHHLFGLSFDDIHVVIHPKSIVHAFVETVDGAIFSHMGRPDMRYPIQYAMTYPDRWETPFLQSHLTALSGLEFFEPDMTVFPLLKLAIECGKKGGVFPIIFNAAN